MMRSVDTMHCIQYTYVYGYTFNFILYAYCEQNNNYEIKLYNSYINVN